MASYCNIYGLLFVFIINLLAISSSVRIVEEPWTDKHCYLPNDKGILSTKVYLPDSLDPLDMYTIAWNLNQDGTGTWFINGSACLIYKASSDENARWKATFVYDHRVMSYTMEVKDMILGDQTPELYALVIDRTKDQIVASSLGTAHFNVTHDCLLPIPTNNIDIAPNTKETDSSSISPTSTSSPTPSHVEEIKEFIRLITTGKFHGGTIPINIGAAFLTIVTGIQLFFPDLYDLIRESCRKLWRWIPQRCREVRQQFYEHGAPEEDDDLNNDPIDIDAK